MKAAATILRELDAHDRVLVALVQTRRLHPTLREICAALHPRLSWAEVCASRAADGRRLVEEVLDVLQDLEARRRVRAVRRDRSEVDTLASLRFEAVRYLHPAPEAAIEGG
jgi:putative heme degradation protein